MSCVVNGLLRGEFLQLPLVTPAAIGGTISLVMAIGLHILGFPYSENVVTTMFTVAAIGGGVVTALGIVAYSIMTIRSQIFGNTSATLVNGLKEAIAGKSIICSQSDLAFSRDDLNRRFDFYYSLISEKTGLPKDKVKKQVLDMLKNDNQNFVVLGKLVVEAEKEWPDKDRIKIRYFAIYENCRSK